MKNITKEKLEELYYSKTNKEVMQLLGVCQDTLLRMVKDAGLKLKGKAYGKRKYTIK